MFPDVEENETLESDLQIANQDASIKSTPFFDYGTMQISIKNGNPEMASEIKAIEQWIVLFMTTPKDVYQIYAGTGFGTSIKKLFGTKILNNGYEESEVEREVKEGFPLCPAIDKVTDFSLVKEGKMLNVYVEVELFNGDLVDVDIQINSYTVW